MEEISKKSSRLTSEQRSLILNRLQKERESRRELISGGGSQFHGELRDPSFNRLSSILSSHQSKPVAFRQQLPKTSPTSRPSSAPPSRKKTKDQLVREREDALRAQCTFKPKVNPPSEKFRRLPQSEKLKVLAAPKTDLYERRERQKREKEELENSACSFKPNITRTQSQSFTTFPERLYLEAGERSVRRERSQRDALEATSSMYSFKPTVSPSSSRNTKSPLHTRLHEIQKERSVNLMKLRQHNEDTNPHTTFKPAINPLSARMATSLNARNETAGLSASERLARDAVHRQERSIRQEQESSSVSLGSVDASRFLERQQEIQDKLQKKRAELIAKMNTYSYRPTIDKTSNLMINSDPERAYEPFDKKIDRWSREESAKRVAKAQSIRDKVYSQFSFEPKLNVISKKLGRIASVNDLSKNEETKLKIKQKAEEQTKLADKHCSFAPDLFQNKKFRHVQSAYRQGSDITSHIEFRQKVKEDRLDKIKVLSEFERLKNCTFKPEHIGKPSNHGDVHVRGLERFMELRQMAKDQEMEKHAREEKAFVLNLGSPQVNGLKTFTFKPSSFS